MSMFDFFFGSLPRSVRHEIAARLDPFCAEATRRVRQQGVRQYRLFWYQKRNTIILSEEYTSGSGEFTRRDSAKFAFEEGMWHLYYVDVTRRWRRYSIAPASADFEGPLRHWIRNATGIFSQTDFRYADAAARRGASESVHCNYTKPTPIV